MQQPRLVDPSPFVYVILQRNVVHHTSVWSLRSVHRSAAAALERVASKNGSTVWTENSTTFVINRDGAVCNDTQADYMILPCTVQP